VPDAFLQITISSLPVLLNIILWRRMVIEVVKELEAAKAKVAELENSLEKEMKTKLARLPYEFGFDDLNSFIKALKGASGARRGRKPGPVKSAGGGGKKRTRARITPEVKDQVKQMVKDEKTGAEIAKALGISLPSVQNIKKELGLVKARK
jgi:hypothetical protein